MQQETILVSVIILLNKQDNFLENTIKSIQHQDYRPLEIIVIDGSVDGKVAEIDQNLLGIQYYHQPNSHKSIQRNFGLSQARGEAIAFLDAGELWTPHKLSQQIAYLKAHPDVEIVQGLIQNIPATAISPSYTEDIERAYKFINLGSLTYRRSVFDKVGLFNETIDFGEEIDWFIRAWEKNIVKISLQQIALLHRQRDPKLVAESTRLYHARLLKVAKKYIDIRKAEGKQFIDNFRSITDLREYIGDIRTESFVNFQRFTIISDDCWSYGPYTDCGVSYSTPFIDIRIEAPCFLELLKDLQGYLESPLIFTTRSKYDGINGWRDKEKLNFPIARLKNNVELLFVHELNEDVSLAKWERRLNRINWDNIFIKFRENPWGFSYEYLTQFHQLNYQHKICFTQKEYPEFDWAISAPDYFHRILYGGNIYEPTKKYFDAVNWVKKSYGSNPAAYQIKQGDHPESI